MTQAEENAALRERVSYLERLLEERLQADSERLVRSNWNLSGAEARVAGMLAVSSPRAVQEWNIEEALPRRSRDEYTSVVKVHVCTLRRKLGGGIKHLRGLGYSMSPELAGRILAVGMLAK